MDFLKIILGWNTYCSKQNCATTLKQTSKEVYLWQANANMNKSFACALNSLNTNRNVQSETHSAEHQSSFDYTSYHYYIETTFKQSIAKIFVWMYIETRYTNNLPWLSDIDGYNVILYVYYNFWNIIYLD